MLRPTQLPAPRPPPTPAQIAPYAMRKLREMTTVPYTTEVDRPHYVMAVPRLQVSCL
jgi:hypothetical protein